MSHIRKSKGLRRRRAPQSAKGTTQRHALVAALAVALGVAGPFVVAGCATVAPAGAGASIDFVDGQGNRGTLDGLRGRLVIVDLCASWAAACNLNAKVLDEVALALAEEPVDIVTLLVDEGEMGQVALTSYVETLGVKHPVLLAGSRVRAGTSALGEAGYVPRLVVLDADGRIVIDDSGGIVSVEGLVKRVRPHLPTR